MPSDDANIDARDRAPAHRAPLPGLAAPDSRRSPVVAVENPRRAGRTASRVGTLFHITDEPGWDFVGHLTGSAAWRPRGTAAARAPTLTS